MLKIDEIETKDKVPFFQIIYKYEFISSSCKYDYIRVQSKAGKHKNDKKTILPYIDKIVNYLLTGKELINQNNIKHGYILLDESVRHFDLELHEFGVKDVLNKIPKAKRKGHSFHSNSRII